MAMGVSFEQICSYLKEQKDPELFDTVDKLLGAIMLFSPVFTSPESGSHIIGLISAKNEFSKIAKSVLNKLGKKKNEGDFASRYRRMEVAYGLIVFTSFFQATETYLEKPFKKLFEFKSTDKAFIARGARKSTLPNWFPGLEVPLPHPAESQLDQKSFRTKIFEDLLANLTSFIEALPSWMQASRTQQEKALRAIAEIPERADAIFEEQYFELCRQFEEFAIWSNIHELKETQKLVGELSNQVKSYIDLSKSKDIDIGLSKLELAISKIPDVIEANQGTKILQGLKNHYNAKLIEPVIDPNEDFSQVTSGIETASMVFPKKGEAFIPQSFKVFVANNRQVRLEHEETWKNLTRRNDLASFLWSYLTSPYSSESPMIILGHPGSGKSLLSTILSARLMSKQFCVVKVPLREVDSESPVIEQIQEQIQAITNTTEAWSKLCSVFQESPPVIILDGYDELLQASGKIFANYLKNVQAFQKNEMEQGRPVRIIVTSRITLIDKAFIPKASTIVRLMEFDSSQRDKWISIWNRVNSTYFRATGVEPLILPSPEEKYANQILTLAEQPLLLLMLALYDSENNQLKSTSGLERTVLYHRLIHRFVRREREKDAEFTNLCQPEQTLRLEEDIRRLGITALGMYNRKKLHILATELEMDLRFFEIEKRNPGSETSGRNLSQADLLLGSFFFVHKSQAQLKSGTKEHQNEAAAFEFLHNTFGEFLVADFIGQETINEIETIKELQSSSIKGLKDQHIQKMTTASGLSRAWFTNLVFTPLFSRPVVFEMIREWVPHLLTQRCLQENEFLSILEETINQQIQRLLKKNTMPSMISNDEQVHPYGSAPLLDHMAVYSANLLLLRLALKQTRFEFNEKYQQIRDDEDIVETWSKLTFLWRSSFGIESLDRLTSLLDLRREDENITVGCPSSPDYSDGKGKVRRLSKIASSLGDYFTAGLSSIALPSEQNLERIAELNQILSSDGVDMEVSLATKRLRLISEDSITSGAEFMNECSSILSLSLAKHATHEEFRQIFQIMRFGLVKRQDAKIPVRIQSAFGMNLWNGLIDYSPRLTLELVVLLSEANCDKAIPSGLVRHVFSMSSIEGSKGIRLEAEGIAVLKRILEKPLAKELSQIILDTIVFRFTNNLTKDFTEKELAKIVPLLLYAMDELESVSIFKQVNDSVIDKIDDASLLEYCSELPHVVERLFILLLTNNCEYQLDTLIKRILENTLEKVYRKSFQSFLFILNLVSMVGYSQETGNFLKYFSPAKLLRLAPANPPRYQVILTILLGEERTDLIEEIWQDNLVDMMSPEFVRALLLKYPYLLVEVIKRNRQSSRQLSYALSKILSNAINDKDFFDSQIYVYSLPTPAIKEIRNLAKITNNAELLTALHNVR